MTGRAATPARFLTSMLIMLAVLAAGMLPKGFMPGTATLKGESVVSVVLCKSTGSTDVLMLADNVPGHAGDAGKLSAHDCPFAAAPTLALTALPALASAIYMQEPPATAPPASINVRTPITLYFAQGPPALFA